MRFSIIASALLATALTLPLAGCKSTPGSSGQNVIRWGSDEAGGAPFEFRDPQNPEKRIGFEVEIADEISSRTGKRVEFVQAQWDTLIEGLKRKDFDFAMAGIEITPERQEEVDFTRPYYIYTQQLVVRADQKDVNKLEDMKGKKVGTLTASAAERVLKQTTGIEVVSYDDNVRPYEDLAIGRLDGVLLDLPIAVQYARPNPKLRFAGAPFAPGQYAIAVRKTDGAFRTELDRVLGDMIADGTLQRILEKWQLWNSAQSELSKK